jgi:hypothetical protein
MNLEKLLHYHELGLIPGEAEDEQAFERRALFCLAIKEKLKSQMENCPPFLDNHSLFHSVKKSFHIDPQWVPVFCSNEKMLPWQGAASWIFQLEEGDPTSALIQLRGRSVSILGTREEALTHEAVHIARMAFEEPIYEEAIAYSTAGNAFRRYFGPLFRSNRESMLLASLLILCVMFDFILLISGSASWYDRFMWLKLTPLSYFAYLWIRLTGVQRRFRAVRHKVGLPRLLLLTDEEITRFAELSQKEIERFLSEGKEGSLRKRLLAVLSGRFTCVIAFSSS